ncbi:MAG: YihY/virulence factor BrkB family protein [Verrucomicrobia bacterium]|nr:YihY/virulence factor BrkB family protein [Verrucomicrobiota bacterium]
MQTGSINTQQPDRWRTLRLAGARWVEVDGDHRAAAFGYYLLLSLLPLIFMLVSAGSLFVEREVATREVVQWVNHYIPLTSEQKRDVEKSIHGVLESRGKFNLAAFPLLVWGALKFLRTLIRSTNRIWHSPTTNWWRLPSRSLGLLAITASAALFGVLVPGAARLVQRWLIDYLDIPSWVLDVVLGFIPWLVLFYGIIMIYKLAPSRPTKFAEVWLAALGATVLIWTGGLLFLLQAAHLGRFNALYGALGSIVAFLLWLYLSSCVGVFGTCFCAAQAEVRENASDHPEKHPAR